MGTRNLHSIESLSHSFDIESSFNPSFPERCRAGAPTHPGMSLSREANTWIGLQVLTQVGVHSCRQSPDAIRQQVLYVNGKRTINHNPKGRMPPNPHSQQKSTSVRSQARQVVNSDKWLEQSPFHNFAERERGPGRRIIRYTTLLLDHNSSGM